MTKCEEWEEGRGILVLYVHYGKNIQTKEYTYDRECFGFSRLLKYRKTTIGKETVNMDWYD